MLVTFHLLPLLFYSTHCQLDAFQASSSMHFPFHLWCYYFTQKIVYSVVCLQASSSILSPFHIVVLFFYSKHCLSYAFECSSSIGLSSFSFSLCGQSILFVHPGSWLICLFIPISFIFIYLLLLFFSALHFTIPAHQSSINGRQFVNSEL